MLNYSLECSSAVLIAPKTILNVAVVFLMLINNFGCLNCNLECLSTGNSRPATLKSYLHLWMPSMITCNSEWSPSYGIEFSSFNLECSPSGLDSGTALRWEEGFQGLSFAWIRGVNFWVRASRLVVWGERKGDPWASRSKHRVGAKHLVWRLYLQIWQGGK